MESFEIFSNLEIIRNKRRSQNPQEAYDNLKKALTREEDINELDRFFKQIPLSKEEKETLEAKLKKEVPNANLKLYNPSVYLALLPYAKLMFSTENNGVPEMHAYMLAVLFNNEGKALEYLKNYNANHNSTRDLMHEACNFAMPRGEFDINTWQKLCAKYLNDDTFRKLILPQASEIERLIRTTSQSKRKPNSEAVKKEIDEIEKISALFNKLERKHGELRSPANAKLVAEMRQVLAKLVRENEEKEETGAESIESDYQELQRKLHNKQMALAELGLPFNEQLTLTMLKAFREKYKTDSSKAYKYFLDHGMTQHDFEKFTALQRQDDNVKIPNIKIDGASFGYEGYYLMKVPVMDEMHAARAACLGKLTNCCQSLSGEAGEKCAIHGLTSPNGGFYVLCKGDINNPQVSDDVIGQCWAWRSKSGAIVFDSIETDSKSPKTTEMVKLFYRNLAKTLVANNHTHKVASGASSGISSTVGIESALNAHEVFVDYDGYCDSKQQLVLYDKEKPFYCYGIDENSTIETIKMIEDTLRDPQPLAKSPLFRNALNWALLHNKKDLIEKMMTMTKEKYPERLEELERSTQFIESFAAGSLLPELADSFMLGIVNKQGLTPLQLAVLSGDAKSASALIDKGADINAKNNQGETVLTIVIQKGKSHKEEALALIEKGANVNVTNSQGKTPLMMAIQTESSDISLAILKKDVDVSVKNTQGETALMMAINKMSDEVVLALIAKEVNINATNNQGQSLLMMAIQKGRDKVALALIKKGADYNAINSQGDTPLMMAIANGCLQVAQDLIAKEAEINAKDNQGDTALMLAASTGHEDIVQALFKKGADINAKNNEGDTALTYAYTSSSPAHKSYRIIQTLIANGADLNIPAKNGFTLLHYAIENGFSDLALVLIAKELNVNTKYPWGDTPLIRAISMAANNSNHKNVAKALIEHGADLELNDKNGYTALITAIQYSQFDLALLLIEKGAQIDVANQANITQWKKIIENIEAHGSNPDFMTLMRAFHRRGFNINDKDILDRSILLNAIMGGHLELVLDLIKQGADVKAQDKDGNNALMYLDFSKSSAIDIALELVKQGIDINSVGTNGNNILMDLVLSNTFSVDNLIKLIDAGAKINTQNADGETALLLALKTFPRSDKTKFILTLLEKGADVNPRDKKGNSPLYYALKSKNETLCLELIKKGTDVNAVNKEGESIVMMATKMNLEMVVQELHKKDAKINEPKERESYEALLNNNPALKQEVAKPSRPRAITFSSPQVRSDERRHESIPQRLLNADESAVKKNKPSST